MKPKILLSLSLVLSGCLVGCSTATQSPPATRLTIIEPWKDVTIKLVLAGSSAAGAQKSKNGETHVKRAVYEIVPNPINGIKDYSILMIHDPDVRKIFFIDGEDSFYISDNAGMRGYVLHPGGGGGGLIWSGSLFELPDTSENDAAIKAFENAFDSQKMKREWGSRLGPNRMSFRQVVTPWYFAQSPEPGGGLAFSEIEAIDLKDGILRLDVRNPSTQIPASLWINLKAEKVTKSIVDGQEMDMGVLSTTNDYGSPLKREK
ncbi:MAG: hypothetical protein ABSA47_09790 [Verrucomicrobiota bacterium]|jgi:hypothetical protein